MTVYWSNTCPKCNSNDTEKWEPQGAGNLYEEEWMCNNCGFSWIAIFLIFENIDKDYNILDDAGNIAENQDEGMQYLKWLKEHNKKDTSYENWRIENNFSLPE